MARKVHIRTFGCQMNAHDSARIADLLQAHSGYEQTGDPANADLVVLNTCSVREKPQEKVFADLGRIKALKRDRPGLLVAVGGCVASQEGEAIIDRAPVVDVVFGPQTLHRLGDLLDARARSGRAQVDIRFPEIEKFDRLPAQRASGATAFVSIMEGCSKYCSFCVVPYTRGPEVSRPFDDVLAECADLVAQGVREITLLGQNVNAWRHTIGGDAADFAALLRYLSDLDGLERIRYTTSHPREFGSRLITAHAELPKLATHVHLPVQSGSDRILATMKRGYTALEYRATARALRRACPAVSLSSDFIVGFPGETEVDFEATLALVDAIGFDSSFAFLYSARPGTPAAALADDTPEAVKLDRLHRLQAKLESQAQQIRQAQVGSVQRVLVEGRSKRRSDELCGRSSANHVVNFPGDAASIGSFVNLRIGANLAHTLRGEPVRSPAAAAR